MQKDNLRRLAITTALGAGNNTLVAGGQLGTGIGSIRVWQIELVTSGAETIIPKSGTTAIPGEIIFTGAGASAVLQATGVPWMECLPGQALVWNLATGGTLTGCLWYSLA
jgi:hypothetical protein